MSTMEDDYAGTAAGCCCLQTSHSGDDHTPDSIAMQENHHHHTSQPPELMETHGAGAQHTAKSQTTATPKLIIHTHKCSQRANNYDTNPIVVSNMQAMTTRGCIPRPAEVVLKINTIWPALVPNRR